VSGTGNNIFEVKEDKGIIHEHNGSSTEVKIEEGDFGEAEESIQKLTGKDRYSIKLVNRREKKGVLTDDGRKMTCKGFFGIIEYVWINNEELAIIQKEGDPIDAPPAPYKIQPDNIGKLLWITGSPGLGKSTSAQLLAAKYGFVFYEADCFAACKNPYVPTDVENPSLAQRFQKPLVGDFLEERRKLSSKFADICEDIIAGNDYEKEGFKQYYDAMCADILKERARIGGDWVVAGVVLNKEVRNWIRSALGPELMIINLCMTREDTRDRLVSRNKGTNDFVDVLLVVHDICEAVEDDEKQAVNIIVTKDMTEHDVIERIKECIH